jgi:uncharacterized membrane protein
MDTEREQIDQNIDAVQDFYSREHGKISRSQRSLERLSRFVGTPGYLGIILLAVAAWVASSLLLPRLGLPQVDPPPFFWMQGVVGLGALLTATVVLIKQNRFAGLAEQRGHLDLKVTLLTEQKTAKLIDLIEELRRDLPNVKNRRDLNADSLQKPMNPELVLAALDEAYGPDRRAEPPEPAAVVDGAA